ncbi:MAG: DNA-directed RNA polymerase subunit alpha C-terminal domain-containing protein [Planctomycetota bacterium]
METKTKAKDIEMDIIVEKENLSIEEIMDIKNEILLLMKLRRQAEKMLSEFDETKKKKFSSQAKAVARKGVICWMLDKTDEAIKYLEEGSSAEENSYFLGLCYLEKGHNEKAHQVLAEVYKKLHDSSYVFSSYIDSLIKVGKSEEILGLLEKGKKRFVTEPMLPYYRGVYLESLGDYDKAQQEFKNALDLDKQYAPALFRLAYHSDLTGNEEEALKIYERLRDIKPPHINMLINLGLVYEDKGDYQKAVECYDAVLNVNPNHPRANLYSEDAKGSLVMYYDDNLKRKEQELKRILNQSLSEFQVPTRAHNCLEVLNIKTIGDLVKKTETELMSSENFGMKTLTDIKDLLARRGLTLSTETKTVTLESLLKSYISTDTPHQTDILNKPIFEVEWSARVRGSLTKLKIYTIGDLTIKTEKDFMDLPNFGQTSLEEIKRRLSQLGLSLKSIE